MIVRVAGPPRINFRCAGHSQEVTPLSPSEATDLRVHLACRPQSAEAARRALADGGLDPDLGHVVCLLATELVGNAVRHAPGTTEIRLDAHLAEGFARVEVRDGGTGFDPEVRHEAAGFGLRLVDKLATNWGVDNAPSGACVWFEIDRRRRRFKRAQ